MEILKNPLTYTLTLFSLAVLTPSIFAGILLLLAIDYSAQGISTILLALAGIFFLIFVFSAAYVQTLLISYAHNGKLASLLNVFSHARKLYWRVLLFDIIALALVLPGLVWMFFSIQLQKEQLLLFGFVWIFLVAIALIHTPKHLKKHSAVQAIKQSMLSWNKQSQAIALRVIGIVSIATISISAIGWQQLATKSIAEIVTSVFGTFSYVLISTTTFFPALLMPTHTGTIATAILSRTIAVACVLFALHTICAYRPKQKK